MQTTKFFFDISLVISKSFLYYNHLIHSNLSLWNLLGTSSNYFHKKH